MEDNMQKVNIKVEFESTPIRHLAIQCPNCNSWFHGGDILKNYCSYDYELYGAGCHCPKCDYDFRIDYKSKFDEDVQFPEFYANCLEQKVSWE